MHGMLRASSTSCEASFDELPSNGGNCRGRPVAHPLDCPLGAALGGLAGCGASQWATGARKLGTNSYPFESLSLPQQKQILAKAVLRRVPG